MEKAKKSILMYNTKVILKITLKVGKEFYSSIIVLFKVNLKIIYHKAMAF